MSKALFGLSYFAGIGVSVGATIVTFFFGILWFEKYLKVEYPENTEENSKLPISLWWFAALFLAEFLNYEGVEENLHGSEVLITAFIAAIINAIIFLICYLILSLSGVEKENKVERSIKAFKGLVIIFYALVFLSEFV